MSVGPTLITDGPKTLKFRRSRPQEKKQRRLLPDFLSRLLHRRRSKSVSMSSSHTWPSSSAMDPPPPSLDELAKREETLVREMMQRRYSADLLQEPTEEPSTSFSQNRHAPDFAMTNRPAVIQRHKSVPDPGSYANFDFKNRNVQLLNSDCPGYSLPPPMPIPATNLAMVPNKSFNLSNSCQPNSSTRSATKSALASSANQTDSKGSTRPPMPLPRSSISHDINSNQSTLNYNSRKSVR